MLRNPIARAMALLTVSMTVIPLMDAFGKLLSTRHDVAPASVALGRFGVQIIWILLAFIALAAVRTTRPVMAERPAFRPSLRPTRIGIHLLRGVLHGSASLLFFVAVTYMPLADAIAELKYTSPELRAAARSFFA